VTIQAQILELLARIRRERGMALLLITHDLGVVAEVCDRVIVMYAGQVVESAPVEELFLHPRHPYTQGLLDSLPKLTAGETHLRPIPGAVPSPLAWPEGCRFRERCPHAWDRCRLEPPPLLSDPESPSISFARCWLLDEPKQGGRTPASARGGSE
jgi:peptide/nickel transport system ATP-binding protein